MFSKRNLIKILSALVAVSIIVFIFFRTQNYPERIIINNRVINVEVVDNEVLMEKGLSGHKPLSDSEGMLFIFSTLGSHQFWMKDMAFSIDIIWFDFDRKIIHIEKDISPDTFPKTYSSKSPSLYTLEVSAGISDKFGLKIGDQFNFIQSNGRKLGL